MHELVLTPRFERSYRRAIHKSPELRDRIDDTLRRMAENVDDSRLRTHHLSGHLAGLYACTVNYDCRIVFNKVKRSRTAAEVLILVDIGTHDEVY